MRQLMDESNYDMVHAVTKHVGNMFIPLLENTTRSYQQLTHQMGKIVNFLGAPPVPPTLVPSIPQGVSTPKNRIVENDQRLEGLDMVLVQRRQDVDQILRQARQNNMGVQDNIINIVEHVLFQNSLNIGLHRPNYISPLSEYVR